MACRAGKLLHRNNTFFCPGTGVGGGVGGIKSEVSAVETGGTRYKYYKRARPLLLYRGPQAMGALLDRPWPLPSPGSLP